MKKTFFLAMLMAFAMVLVGCSKDDDNDSKDDSRANAQQIDTYTIEPCFVYGTYLHHPKDRNYYYGSWGSEGTSFDVFILQGGVFKSIGKLHSVETSIASADNQKAVHLQVPIPAGINTDIPYQVVAVCAPGDLTLTGGKIVNTMELKRGVISRVDWYVMQSGKTAAIQASYLATLEGLFITNNTSNTIKVKHKGYSSKEKWYYTKGSVSITPSLTLETSGQTSVAEAESPEMEINAGEYGCIDSRYVPTGKKMTDASLILEIDGKEVRTAPASSDVSIENGIPCFLKVKWDGTNLEWD